MAYEPLCCQPKVTVSPRVTFCAAGGQAGRGEEGISVLSCTPSEEMEYTLMRLSPRFGSSAPKVSLRPRKSSSPKAMAYTFAPTLIERASSPSKGLHIELVAERPMPLVTQVPA